MTKSFEKDVKPLFRQQDVDCMSDMGVALTDYGYMSAAAANDKYPDHANARDVYCHLLPSACTPRMPMGGPYWSQGQLDIFNQWMIDGFLP
jgi:hypothetical protein